MRSGWRPLYEHSESQQKRLRLHLHIARHAFSEHKHEEPCSKYYSARPKHLSEHLPEYNPKHVSEHLSEEMLESPKVLKVLAGMILSMGPG